MKNIYFAPLEGITGYIFRTAYDRCYGGIDKYFAPFSTPSENCPLTPRETRDILPENNQGITLVPQILTRNATHFNEAAQRMSELGYHEMNLNLGCPSGTVCAKGKGAGFLSFPEELDAFLNEIFSYAQKHELSISIKTRIGRKEPEEWERLLKIYNQYPICELIVHPRLACEFYKGEPHLEQFDYTLANSKAPVVYNGNLFTPDDIDNCSATHAIMLGRGLLFNPQLLQQTADRTMQFDYDKLWQLHDEVYEEYKKIMAPDIHVINHMKELWNYWGGLFPDGKKQLKEIYKSKKYAVYDSAVNQLKSQTK